MTTPTPLSDAITALQAQDDPQAYQRFLDLFLNSWLGIIAGNLPDAPLGVPFRSDGSVTVARTGLPDGRVMIRACADLHVFVKRFDKSFNAEIPAAGLMKAALEDPECEGILVNSAASFHSAIITRATIEALCAPPARKPWWKFW